MVLLISCGIFNYSNNAFSNYHYFRKHSHVTPCIDRGGPPAVLVPMNTDVGPMRRHSKLDINPLPPIQNNVAPPPFVPGIKDKGELPVINEPFQSSRHGDSALGDSNDEDDLEIPIPDHVDSKALTLQLQEKKVSSLSVVRLVIIIIYGVLVRAVISITCIMGNFRGQQFLWLNP